VPKKPKTETLKYKFAQQKLKVIDTIQTLQYRVLVDLLALYAVAGQEEVNIESAVKKGDGTLLVKGSIHFTDITSGMWMPVEAEVRVAKADKKKIKKQPKP
jgi:hypothetical protein